MEHRFFDFVIITWGAKKNEMLFANYMAALATVGMCGQPIGQMGYGFCLIFSDLNDRRPLFLRTSDKITLDIYP